MVRQVGDFGLAHLVGANTSLQSNTWGSIAYMAPVGAKGGGGCKKSVALSVSKGWRGASVKFHGLASRVLVIGIPHMAPSCPRRDLTRTEAVLHPVSPVPGSPQEAFRGKVSHATGRAQGVGASVASYL